MARQRQFASPKGKQVEAHGRAAQPFPGLARKFPIIGGSAVGPA
jgi:hypothetical protein